MNISLVFRFLNKVLWFQNRRFNSVVYWQERYRNNGNSGSGSYGRLASFKAQFLNDFVKTNKIENIIELGCGDGNQLKLAKYKNYIGMDVSQQAIETCKILFKKDPGKKFYLLKDVERRSLKAQLVLSLDVIYHLIEDALFNKYMSDLFKMSDEYVIIYSSNHDENIAPHVKCRRFSQWVEENIKNFELLQCVKNKFPFDPVDPDNTSLSDFYIYKRRI